MANQHNVKTVAAYGDSLDPGAQTAQTASQNQGPSNSYTFQQIGCWENERNVIKHIGHSCAIDRKRWNIVVSVKIDVQDKALFV